VAFNAGEGGFGPFINLLSNVSSLAAADLDRDGQTDLALTNMGADRVAVLLNRTFAVPFSDSFSGGAGKWKALTGTWRTGGGAFGSTRGAGLAVARGITGFRDGRLRARVKVPAAPRQAGVAFAVRDRSRLRHVLLSAGGTVSLGQTGQWGADPPGVLASAPFPLQAGRWYDLQVDLGPGPLVRVLLDGKPVLEGRFRETAAGRVGLRTTTPGYLFDDVSVMR
jgi:hypothetical protein